jgi:hypothetical protein
MLFVVVCTVELVASSMSCCRTGRDSKLLYAECFEFAVYRRGIIVMTNYEARDPVSLI